MIITSIEIKNFRNIDNKIIELNKNKNEIIGKNGSGKTSILEAIFFAINLTSFRSSKKSTIKIGQLYVKISLLIDNTNKLDILYNQSLTKVFINNEPVLNYNDLRKYNKIIFFNPMDFNILIGPMSAKRKMLNFNIGQINDNYLNILNEIKFLQKEKAKLLSQKNFFECEKKNDEILILFMEIYKFRKNYLKQLKEKIKSNLNWNIKYQIPKINLQKINLEEKKSGKNKLSLDIDKLIITINDLEIKQIASRGQLKKIIFELCYGQKLLLENFLKEKVVILIDDLHAEFDDENIESVFEMFKENQIIYTKINNSNEVKYRNVSRETFEDK